MKSDFPAFKETLKILEGTSQHLQNVVKDLIIRNTSAHSRINEKQISTENKKILISASEKMMNHSFSSLAEIEFQFKNDLNIKVMIPSHSTTKEFKISNESTLDALFLRIIQFLQGKEGKILDIDYSSLAFVINFKKPSLNLLKAFGQLHSKKGINWNEYGLFIPMDNKELVENFAIGSDLFIALVGNFDNEKEAHCITQNFLPGVKEDFYFCEDCDMQCKPKF